MQCLGKYFALSLEIAVVVDVVVVVVVDVVVVDVVVVDVDVVVVEFESGRI